MSIEQKIAQMLAESRANENADNEETIEEGNVVMANANAGDRTPIRTAKNVISATSEVRAGNGGEGKESSGDQAPIRTAANVIPATAEDEQEDNDRNNDEHQAGALDDTPAKKVNKVTAKQVSGDAAPVRNGTAIPATAAGKAVNFKEDVDALINGEDLSEEFKTKAATIFEAAIVTRVKEEVARLEEEFEARIQEEAAKNQEGLVEKVDGYLSYVAEQWIANNEIALESGMKSDILEGFVSGLKGLFEEHYIDVPEEKFDVLASMEETVLDLQAKLDEQVQANVEMAKALNENARAEIIYTASEGLTDTDKEKFFDLAEELSFDDAETFEKKVQTIRENYFTNKASTIVESVVTDTPIEALTEEKFVDPKMKNYMSTLNNLK